MNQLNNELEDVKKFCDDEAKERQSLLGRFRNLEHEYDGMSTVLDEEITSKENLQRQCHKAESEANIWRMKYEKDGIAKIEELEHIKMKLQARLAECEGTVENLNSKLINLEKHKATLQENIEEMSAKVDHATIVNSQAEKKMKQFDKVVLEWKNKADGLTQELDVSQRECRNVSSELFRVKNGYEECMGQLDEVRRENKNLSDEIKDIMEQISEGGRSILSSSSSAKLEYDDDLPWKWATTKEKVDEIRVKLFQTMQPLKANIIQTYFLHDFHRRNQHYYPLGGIIRRSVINTATKSMIRNYIESG